MNIQASPMLTILTPVYNRAALLGACYDSLRRQTDRDFEWIVVDDGSSDNSADVAEAFSADLFPIRVIRKENGGKHTAINAAIPHIRGQYVLILDSDDTLTEHAVEAVRAAWKRYSAVEQIGVVIFLRGRDLQTPFCTVPQYEVPADILTGTRIRHITTDCCEVIRAELLRRYPFPEFPGERFLSECALWNRVARTHKCVYINKIIYLCEFLEDGLTRAGRSLRIRNPLGGMFISELRMGPNNVPGQRIKYAMLYCCYGFFAKLPPAAILGRNRAFFLLRLMCLLPGYLLHLHWKRICGGHEDR